MKRAQPPNAGRPQWSSSGNAMCVCALCACTDRRRRQQQQLRPHCAACPRPSLPPRLTEEKRLRWLRSFEGRQMQAEEGRAAAGSGPDGPRRSPPTTPTPRKRQMAPSIGDAPLGACETPSTSHAARFLFSRGQMQILFCACQEKGVSLSEAVGRIPAEPWSVAKVKEALFCPHHSG